MSSDFFAAWCLVLVQRRSCLVCSACLVCCVVCCLVLPGVLSSCCAGAGCCAALCRCAPCLVCSGVQVCALFLLPACLFLLPFCFFCCWCCASHAAVLLLPAWCCTAVLPGACLVPACLVLPVSFAVLLEPGAAGALVLVQRRVIITSSSAVALSITSWLPASRAGLLRAIPCRVRALAVAQHAINLCILPPFITSIVGQSSVDLVPLGFQPNLYSVEHSLIMAYVPQRRYLVTL